ncbi:LppU family putative lipoprotein [Mycobacterium sp.]|uniref:LppU family putative lipoprotein n=1 Tax=Mycobacterium sp. TaxID=1785 RepID=UPI003D6B0717
MRAWPTAAITAVAIIGGATGCSAAANVADLKVGDCLRLGGTADRPEATKVTCGSRTSNFKVAATVKDRGQCPADVDSSYSMRNGFSDSSTTACLDIDWVVGGCMNVDPQNNSDPVRVDCNDKSAPHRQRAIQILRNLQDPVSVDQCASGVGYAYAQRRFAVCVEDMT